MFYVPEDYLDQDYSYFYNGNYYTIVTDNCVDNQCQCYSLFSDENYLISNVYTCTSPENQFEIDYSNLSSDHWYRKDLPDVLICFFILFIFMIYMPYRIMSRAFGRWLKV